MPTYTILSPCEWRSIKTHWTFPDCFNPKNFVLSHTFGDDQEWSLVLYPQGKFEKGNPSIYLRNLKLMNQEDETPVTADFRIEIRDWDTNEFIAYRGYEAHVFSHTEHTWGFQRFCKDTKDLLKTRKSGLTVIVEMQVCVKLAKVVRAIEFPPLQRSGLSSQYDAEVPL